jgi:hypothetical protein
MDILIDLPFRCHYQGFRDILKVNVVQYPVLPIKASSSMRIEA